jgi:hypothetical protein
MEMSYIQLSYCKKNERNPEIAIIAIPFEDGGLISDDAKRAKEKLEQVLGEHVLMIDYTWLGTKVTIVA